MFTTRRAIFALPRASARFPRARAPVSRIVQSSQSAFYSTEAAAEQVSTNPAPVQAPTPSSSTATETSAPVSPSSTTPESQHSSSNSSPSTAESTAPAPAPSSSQNARKPFAKRGFQHKKTFVPNSGTKTTQANGQPASESIASNHKPASSGPVEEVTKQAGASTTASRPTFVESGRTEREQQDGILDLDWTSSFHGVSTKAVTEIQYKTLMAPIDIQDVEVKPDGIIYLPEIKYRRKMNETFGPMGWGLVPRGEPVVGQNVVTREFALIVDGRFVSQSQGENQYFSTEQLPSAVEGCKSNALMRCCKDLGVASELWDPKFIRSFRKKHVEAVWVEHASTKKKRQLYFRKGEIEVAYPWKQTSS